MFSLVVLILVISGILLDWIFVYSTFLLGWRLPTLGDSVRRLDGWGLLHWYRYAFFWGGGNRQLLGLSRACFVCNFLFCYCFYTHFLIPILVVYY